MGPDPTAGDEAPVPAAGDPDAPAPAGDAADDLLDAMLDAALEETFPASDPVAISPRAPTAPADATDPGPERPR